MLSEEATSNSSNTLPRPSKQQKNIMNIKHLSSLTRANSQFNIKKIPRPSIRNKIISNTKNNSFTTNNNTDNILSDIQEGFNPNFLYNIGIDENSKINLLKKNYDNRLNNLFINFTKTINNLTKDNAKELINDVIFKEKEKVIADLYEQNAIIKNEYEENKNEMSRLQEIISALEIDLHKTQKKLDLKNEEIKKLNEIVSKQQAENFDLNLKIKGLLEQIENDKNDNKYINLSKDLNFSIGNIGIGDIALASAQEKSVLQLTEELKELNKLKDNKDDMNDINDNFTCSTLNSNNTNKYEDIINNLKNNNKELEQELNLRLKEIKELKESNKKYQIELDNNLSEFSKLNNKYKLNEQITILLRSKISSIKSEFKSFQKFVQDKLNIYNKDNQSIIKIINQNLFNYFKINNSNNNPDNNTRNIINSQKNIQELYEQINIYEANNKSLNKKCIAYEKENQNLVGEINKLNNEIQIMNQKLNIYQNSDNIENTNVIKKYKTIMKNKIYIMRNKYIQQIGELKTMISVLNCGMKKYNSILIQYSMNKNNEEKKNKLIEEMQKKINGMKMNQEEYIKALNRKNKKIKELQSSLKNSLANFSSGLKNIKIANLLDNEVKEVLKKSKENKDNEKNNNEE
jgi:chromosome segregation ATPase